MNATKCFLLIIVIVLLVSCGEDGRGRSKVFMANCTDPNYSGLVTNVYLNGEAGYRAFEVETGNRVYLSGTNCILTEVKQ